MSKPNEPAIGPGGRPGRLLVALGAAALVAAAGLLAHWPLGASAALASTADDRVPPRQHPARAAAPAPKASTTYQLRCWQYGRLLFDEGPVTLGSDTRQAARLVATDRDGAALIVTDTGATTCLARPYSAAPQLGLPR